MKNSKTVAFFIPCAGQTHQAYLQKLYDGIVDIDKRIITYYTIPGGWCTEAYCPILLSRRGVCYKGLNYIFKRTRSLHKKWKTRNRIVPQPPLGWLRSLDRIIEHNSFDLLHFVYAGAAAAVLPYLAKREIPFTVNFAGSDVQVAERNGWYMDNLRYLWTHAVQCSFASHFLRNQSLQHGCDPDKGHVMYLGTEIHDYIYRPRKSKSIEYVCVANLLPVKGHCYLIEAFSSVLKQIPDARLTLIGDGPEKQRLQNMAADNHIEQSIVFAGTLNSTQIKEVLLHSDIYVQPSIRAENGDEEGLAQATLESQVFGLPAIVTNTGGLPEAVIHNQNGILVEQKNAHDLAQAMVTLANDRDLRNTMGQNAYHSVRERFDLNKCNQRWNTFFCDAMKQL